MNVISRIKDENIGQRCVNFNDLSNRCAAYGIVKRDDKIALINVSNRGYYLLPGGAISENIDYRSAFMDKMYEQLGCRVDVEKIIGAIEEERFLKLFKQTSYVFLANVTEYNEKKNYTEDEIFNGVKIDWVNEDRALSIVALAYDNLDIDDAEDLYDIKFNVKKSQTILEEYLKNK